MSYTVLFESPAEPNQIHHYPSRTIAFSQAAEYVNGKGVTKREARVFSTDGDYVAIFRYGEDEVVWA